MSKVRRATIPGACGPRRPGHRAPSPKILPLTSIPATAPTAAPSAAYADQLGIGAGRRTLSISLAVLITALLLSMLLSFGPGRPRVHEEERISVVNISAPGVSAETPEPTPERERAEEKPAPSRPAADEPQPPSEPASPLPPPPAAPATAPAAPPPSPAVPRIGVRPPGGQVYGPPDTGGAASSRDSVRVGTAPNGEPLYAATWYREPSDNELRGYLSTASGPGWGLIACRTAPDYRVEDCVGLDEYPNGSQINRAVLAAAWQFRVRPARIGGRPQVGSWVRIRIDYSIGRR